MSALSLFGLGSLILTLLPNIVFTLERRATPWPYHIALAACGILYCGLASGAIGALLAAFSGIGVSLFLAIAVACTQNRFGYRTMSGSEIRLFGAVAAWFPPHLAIATVSIFFVTVTFMLYIRHFNETKKYRPNLNFYITASMLTVFCYHLGSLS
jgi:hypothetical protein